MAGKGAAASLPFMSATDAGCIYLGFRDARGRAVAPDTEECGDDHDAGQPPVPFTPARSGTYFVVASPGDEHHAVDLRPWRLPPPGSHSREVPPSFGFHCAFGPTWDVLHLIVPSWSAQCWTELDRTRARRWGQTSGWASRYRMKSSQVTPSVLQDTSPSVWSLTCNPYVTIL